MLLFGVCFVLYFIKLSAGKGIVLSHVPINRLRPKNISSSSVVIEVTEDY